MPPERPEPHRTGQRRGHGRTVLRIEPHAEQISVGDSPLRFPIPVIVSLTFQVKRSKEPRIAGGSVATKQDLRRIPGEGVFRHAS